MYTILFLKSKYPNKPKYKINNLVYARYSILNKAGKITKEFI
jgi:hypothetical protein